MATQIALFGGSFDPIHHGHLIAARAVAERLGLNRVILLPSAHPPHKSPADLTDASVRAEMVRLAVAEDPLFDVSDYDLARTGPSFTFDTIEHFQGEFGCNTRVFWLIGADSLPDLPSWHRAAELVERCPIITAARPGWSGLDWARLGVTFTDAQIGRLESGIVETPLVEVSSTDIRSRVRNGQSIRYLVPDCIREFIQTRRVYRDPRRDS